MKKESYATKLVHKATELKIAFNFDDIMTSPDEFIKLILIYLDCFSRPPTAREIKYAKKFEVYDYNDLKEHYDNWAKTSTKEINKVFKKCFISKDRDNQLNMRNHDDSF